MKKFVVLSFVVIALLASGCEGKEKTLTCTKEEEVNNLKSKMEVTLYYKNDKIFKITQNSTNEIDPSLLEQTLSFNEEFADSFKDINGFDISYSKEGTNTIKSTTTIDYSKLDVNELKDKFGEDFNEEEFTKYKDKNIEEYQKEELEGFTCK